MTLSLSKEIQIRENLQNLNRLYSILIREWSLRMISS